MSSTLSWPLDSEGPPSALGPIPDGASRAVPQAKVRDLNRSGRLVSYYRAWPN